MSAVRPLFGLTSEQRQRAAQLQDLLPTLESKISLHYKPYSLGNVAADPKFAVILLSHVIHLLNDRLLDTKWNSLSSREALPAFVLDLFSNPPALHYPLATRRNLWAYSENLHDSASFFVRAYPNSSIFDLVQYLIGALAPPGRVGDASWSLATLKDPLEPSPYDEPFSNDAAVEQLYRHLISCHARVGLEAATDAGHDIASAASTTRVFEIL